jgi:DNA processing protein
MQAAILFKIIQRRNKFRNPLNLAELPRDFIYTAEEYDSAQNYILSLKDRGISYCYPGHENYPEQFLKMKEAPLFFEYVGAELWKSSDFIAVVGSRKSDFITDQWLKTEFEPFVRDHQLGVVSGGAVGVDQLAHLIAIKNHLPTLFILPSGLLHLYPPSLNEIKRNFTGQNVCFVSEFETHQQLHKSHFYFRNRLIAAFGKATLVAQASLKSGSLLTVHHCLEMGKQVITVPAHPVMYGFDGNLKLLQEGATLICNKQDLHDFWLAESWPN